MAQRNVTPQPVNGIVSVHWSLKKYEKPEEMVCQLAHDLPALSHQLSLRIS
ncbi:hypothetical protein AB4Y40_34470 [Paraburkholderia sp. EG287B]|uniref:hypothetical protein n=1 Tax=unclassified Paraburkholderia TaxID=2615204 RepID=UPI0034D15D70